MDIHPINNQCPLNALLPSVFIPNELIAEILSFLNVKTISQFRCACKSWNTLISDPTFIKMHLKKSSQIRHYILTPLPYYPMNNVVSFPINPSLENPPITFGGNSCHKLKDGNCQIVGFCNGLICLLFFDYISKTQTKYWFCLWNPAMRTISENFGVFIYWPSLLSVVKFSFGCDCLTGTYKVVALHKESNKARVFSFGDDCWRDIQSFPLAPLRWNHDVHLCGTVNWISIRGGNDISGGEISKVYIPHVEQFVIVSLDLSTETYTQILLPKGFNEVPYVEPSIQVLRDCLCFSYDFKGTEIVLWEMKEFGVQESWTQLFRIEYVNLQLHKPDLKDCVVGLMERTTTLLPRYLSMNGDTFILTTFDGKRVIIYNQRDRRVERLTISDNVSMFSVIDYGYAESLVSTTWKSGGIKEGKDEEERYLLSEDEDPLSHIALGVDGWDLFF